MPRIRGQVTGSGFIVRSPRILLDELDNHGGSYSTVQRTGDTSRPGTLATNFDDSTTIIFSETGNPVFPSMLPHGNTFNSQAVDILGQESDISITAPIRSAQHPTYLHYSPEEQMGPFNENRVMPATDFFLSGTNPDVMPGFTSPLRSKIAVDIDITPASDFTLTRNYACRNPNTQDRTGFAYFNFADKLWQDIGLRDPVNGGLLQHDVAFNALTTAFPVLSGSQGILSQFVGVFNHANYLIGSATGSLTAFNGVSFGVTTNNDDLTNLRKLMSHACSPSVINGAPFNTRYFATSSQIVNLKNQKKIFDPMLLEAVSVNMDVEVQCYFTASNVISAQQVARFFMPSNNYVFFLYTQKKSYRSSTLTSAEVSGSTRSLIASASITFVHAASEPPKHSPALLFTLTSSSPLYPTNNPVVVQYTGSLNFSFKPGVCSRKWTASHRPAITSSATEQTRNFQHFWPGGASAEVFNNELWTSQKKGSLLPTLTIFGASGSDADYNSQSILSSYHFRQFGGEVASPAFFNLDSFSTAGAVVSIEDGRIESPYLLMPDDEIILGIEQVPMNFDHTDPENDFKIYQSSSMTIKSNSSKITLHGSLISDSREANLSLNQNLSSNSVHEIIGAEPVLDQFQIEPISSYYGSYLDEIVTGSMANPSANTTLFTITDQDNSRRIISRVSLGQAGTTGSLQRFVKMIDQTERTYDSCLPDFNVMLPSATKTASEYSYISENVPLFTGVEWEQEKDLPESIVLQFPFASNPTRNKQKTIGIVGADTTGVDVERTDYIASSPVDITGRELDNMNILYKTRYEYVSYAAYNDVYRINQTFYTFETTRPINVTDGLVSYYRLKRTPALEASAIATLEDSIYNNDLTGTPTDGDSATHTGPKYYKGSPLFPFDSTLAFSGRAAFSQFVSAGTSANVRYFEDAGDYDDHKMVDDVSSPTADVPFSLSCVFYLENLGTTQTLIERRNTTAREYTLEVNSSNYLRFYKGRGNTTTDFRSVLANASGSNVDADTWYHVLVTYNGVDSNSGDNVNIYINGVLQTTKTLSSVGSPAIMNTNSSSRLRLGTGMTAGGTGIIPDAATEITAGRIFSVGVWKNKELSAQDANDLYQAELVGSCFGNVRHRVGAVDSFIGKAPAFRYGISNIDPEFSSARWNATSFGQPRDMLESRLGITTSDGTPPVKIHFVSGSTYNADPNNTHAQNISVFATSSIPWIDDGLFRNREDNPDETLLIF